MALHRNSIDEETLAETVEVYKKHIGSPQPQMLTAKELGIAQSTLSERLKRAAERGLLGTAATLPGFRIRKITNTPKGDFIQQGPEIGDEFKIPDGQVIKGVSALVDADGRTIQQWIKTKTDATMPVVVEALKKVFSEYEGTSRPSAVMPRDSVAELMSVYPIADQHNGLLAWGKETGEAYDLAIGAQRFRECATKLFRQSPFSHRAVILNLGDWQHTDDSKNMTPGHGNILDVDSRYFKIVTTGVQLMIDYIEMALEKHDEIEVRNIPGNHDPHSSVALTVALDMFYRNNPRVSINCDPGDFYYRRFGTTLIGATHGHKMKPERMAMDMAVTQREDWGATDYHWFLFGHIHHETAKEVGDVRVESFQTLAAKDAYSAGRGYTSGQSLQSITLHHDEGEIGRHRVNLPSPYRKSKA